MSIFSRTRDIIAANVIDLINRSDDPAKTIRVIILEMEETLVEVRASAARGIADQKEKRRQIAQIEQMQDKWAERAELALSKGRDDLARQALIEKEKLNDLADEIGDEVAGIEQGLRAFEGDIAKLQAKLREARVRQNAIATRFESAQNRVRLRELYAGSRTEQAFASFDLLEREADYAEGQAEALMLAAPRTLEEELAELKVAERVDAELEAMKAAEDRGMTLSIDGTDVGEIIEVASLVGGIVDDADRRAVRLFDGPPAQPRARAPQGGEARRSAEPAGPGRGRAIVAAGRSHGERGSRCSNARSPTRSSGPPSAAANGTGFWRRSRDRESGRKE